MTKAQPSNLRNLFQVATVKERKIGVLLGYSQGPCLGIAFIASINTLLARSQHLTLIQQ